MNEKLKKQLDALIASIESRQQSEKIIVLVMLIAGLAMAYLTLAFDPVRADINRNRSTLATLERQIQAQQTSYADMLVISREDPNKFANDRLAVVAREQAMIQAEITALAGDLVTPNEMTVLLTSVLENQAGLQLVAFRNLEAAALREGLSNVDELLQETGAVRLDEVRTEDVSGQIYEHGLVIEFEGDFFSTLKYLQFLEQVTGSFYWDTVNFRQLEWPLAHVTLEIHTLSRIQGFIGV